MQGSPPMSTKALGQASAVERQYMYGLPPTYRRSSSQNVQEVAGSSFLLANALVKEPKYIGVAFAPFAKRMTA